ncbi:MAG: HK97-gp10 family putative phage morphogenesis protein [Devosia sp.]
MAKIKGLKSLEAKLKRIPKEARSAIRQALAESADDIVSTMKNLAPVSKNGSHGWEPGMLRESIVATFGDGSVPKYAAFRNRRGRRPVQSNDPDLSVTITAGNEDVRYAHLVEFGTAPRINGGKFKGTRHPGTAAQPFFYPGYRAHRRRVKARISRAISRSARKAVGK